ncbi:hypothetical protein [Massilibacteroides vaginae]|uniref:hypothetical protein n=1 Tax=Massilibacteroides vaginae TaxID=1673718 RepID=UPI000A1C8D2C|nr:hypothetical protein [Massilibacteroides vaginae]
MKNPCKIVKDCIENEEPVFVLRGKDIFAIKAIQAYYESVKNGGAAADFVNEINEICKDFEAFANESNVKIPD